MITSQTAWILGSVLLLGSCTNVYHLDNRITGSFNPSQSDDYQASSTHTYNEAQKLAQPSRIGLAPKPIQAPALTPQPAPIVIGCDVAPMAPLIVKPLDRTAVTATRSESELLNLVMNHTKAVDAQIRQYNSMVQRHNAKIAECKKH